MFFCVRIPIDDVTELDLQAPLLWDMDQGSQTGPINSVMEYAVATTCFGFFSRLQLCDTPRFESSHKVGSGIDDLQPKVDVVIGSIEDVGLARCQLKTMAHR